MTNTNTAIGAELITAAQAVVDRWDTPLWKDVPATAEYIGRLRAALASAAAPAPQPNTAYAALPDTYYLAGGEVKTWDENHMRAFADATCALRASRGQAPAQAAPAAVAHPGWKLVPVEPTPEMLSEIWAHKNGSLSEAYRAMLAAAPQTYPTPQADSQPAVDEATAMNRTRELAESCRWPSDWVEAYRRGYSDRAARAPADSGAAPAKSEWDVRGHLATSLSFWHRLKNGEDDEIVAAFRKWAPPSCTTELDELRKAFRPHDLTQEWTSEHSRNYPGKAARIINAASAAVLTATATSPAQAADSVLEDAARLDWLDRQCEAYGFQDIHEGNRWEISGPYANVRVAIDAERAARKQGGA